MNESEYKLLESHFKQSTCAAIGEYLRQVGLQKPVTIKYRNQSADEILAEIISLKKELNAIGNNFNQAVHRLHTLDRIPEFRSWIMIYESTKQAVENKISEIKIRMDQIYKQWLHV